MEIRLRLDVTIRARLASVFVIILLLVKVGLLFV
jgi:hypothetical protein